MADMVAEVVAEAQAHRRSPERRGVFDLRGTLWSPDGMPLRLVEESVGAGRALELLRLGAGIVFEGCGCGGQYCHPEWATDDQRRALEADGIRESRGQAPTWIDVWAGDNRLVVFLHGQFLWP